MLLSPRSLLPALPVLLVLAPAMPAQAEAFDLQQRRAGHWAWQPLADPEPPAVADPSWCLDPLDRFVLRRLQDKGLSPAPDADRATWLRRVTFDLIGLPPTPEELARFLADDSPAAFGRVVDRLLASPHFGERWARHWLDLVRYAETLGHEYDFPIPNAWRYRDYVIRSLNDDLPYDRFAIEHIAGDLLPDPRRDPETGDNLSVIATGSFWFCEQTHSPVDVYRHLADRVDNQLDVMGKTFLGLTVGCARCHDHKFDAISTADYYSLFGFLDSSRYAQVQISPPLLGTPAEPAVRRAMAEAAAAGLAALREAAPQLERNLAEALRRLADGEGAGAGETEDPLVERWLAVLEKPEGPAWDPLRALAELAATPHQDWPERWRQARAASAAARTRRAGDLVRFDFDRDDYRGWFADGDAFGRGPVAGPLMLPDAGGRPRPWRQPGRWAHSGALGPRRQGVLSSPSFRLDRPYVHVAVAGRGGRVALINEGFHLIRNPIYGGLRRLVDDPVPHWITFDVRMWQGHRAWLTFTDQVAPDLADPDRPEGHPADAWLAVQRVVFSEESEPPPAPGTGWPLGSEPPADPGELAARTTRALAAALQESASPPAHLARWLAVLQARELIAPPGDAAAAALSELARLDAAEVRTAPGTLDGTGADGHVFLRGNPHDLGTPTPRRFLQALDGPEPLPLPAGSGRLQLARRMFAADNPLPARVIANRLWHHLTGRGIVATTDNLGHLGERPTHPELLDWLARRLVDEGWSLKSLIRRIALSRTYRMTSRIQPDAEKIDPGAVWLHRMRLRRLEAEAIRDAILAVAGTLDRTCYGPPVPAHLTRFLTGRGRPRRSGPLDGECRRTIYQEVRRNFLSPTLLAFDLPTPFGTVGCRGRSNVPAQALATRNDPFVVEQCRHWAEGLLAAGGSPRQRVEAMYRTAFARPPDGDELRAALDFVAGQARESGCGLDDPRPWADLGHVLINLPEFVFLP